MWSCEYVCNSLRFLINNIFIRNGKTVNRRTVAIPLGTNCTSLIADLFLFRSEKDFMLSIFRYSKRYLDDILNIDNPIHPPELKLIRANSSDEYTSFLGLYWIISNSVVKTKFMTRDDFSYPHLSGDIPRVTSNGVYIS